MSSPEESLGAQWAKAVNEHIMVSPYKGSDEHFKADPPWTLTRENVKSLQVSDFHDGIMSTTGTFYIPESFGWPEMAGCHFGGLFGIRDGHVVSVKAMTYMGPLTPEGRMAGYPTGVRVPFDSRG